MYIKFEDKDYSENLTEASLFRRIVIGFFQWIFPQANPDFDKKYDLVKTWLLEFENENSEPLREVGLDNQNRVIVIGPFGKNLGYWTDNSLMYSDFERFNPEKITPVLFDQLWNQFGHTP